jgi:hypothetical protein
VDIQIDGKILAAKLGREFSFRIEALWNCLVEIGISA